MNNFNLRLRDAMHAASISPKDLASKLGVDHSSVNVWLRGDNLPTEVNREKVVAFF